MPFPLTTPQTESKSQELIQEFPAYVSLVEAASSLKMQLQEAKDEATRLADESSHNLSELELSKAQEVVSYLLISNSLLL